MGEETLRVHTGGIRVFWHAALIFTQLAALGTSPAKTPEWLLAHIHKLKDGLTPQEFARLARESRDLLSTSRRKTFGIIHLSPALEKSAARGRVAHVRSVARGDNPRTTIELVRYEKSAENGKWGVAIHGAPDAVRSRVRQLMAIEGMASLGIRWKVDRSDEPCPCDHLEAAVA